MDTIYWTSHYITKYFDKEILRYAMDTLYNAGVTGKLYRLWFMLNKSAFGISDLAPTGENVVQGGGGLISTLNLRKTKTAYFSGSDSEIRYGTFSPCYIPLDFVPGLRKLKKETF